MRATIFALGNAVLCLLAQPAHAADAPMQPVADSSIETTTQALSPVLDEVINLKIQLAAQQKQLAIQQEQIERLRVALEAQQKPLNRTVPEAKQSDKLLQSDATVASAGFSNPLPAGDQPQTTTPVQPSQPGIEPPAPLSLKIGHSFLTPVGFIDVTYVGRTTNVGSGIGTNFASIPFNNVPQGHLTDGFLSLQNSRIGARFDSIFKGVKLLGYWESDFLGAQPTNVLVSTNADTFRLRLFWVDLKKDRWEILAGQSWSLITPGRKGISPLPSDIFYSQNVDTNYQVGIPWGRVPSFRFVWHATDHVAWAVAAENSQQYIGGSAGAPVVTLPASLVGPLTNQLDNGTNSFSVPTLNPDIISKVAFDPVLHDRLWHVEVAGMFRTFRIYNSLTNNHFSKAGGSMAINSNLELVKGGRLRFVENFYWGRGVGRWLFGQGPDLIVNRDGNLGLLPGGAASVGLESQAIRNTTIYGYYGGDYFGRGIAVDTNGAQIGYGFTGSSNSNNRTIQEFTAGVQYTLWKNPRWGALQLFGQYSYLFRNPWYVASTAPSEAHTNMYFVNLRYSFPGEAPSLK
jgi:hypothetical protein